MASTSRRIRFAPLPDPRRLVLVTDDGAELPLTPDPESKLDPDAPDGDADPVCIPAYFSLQALSPKPSSPCPSTLVSGSATSESSEPSSSSSSSASSMHSLTPTQSIEPSVTAGSRTPTQSNQSSFKPRRNTDLFAKITSKKLTAEQILTLGAINLFKSNKGKNKAFAEDVPPSAWGSSLTRWTSGGSAHSFGAPLSRSQSTQSTQTYKGGNVRKKPRSSSASATDSSKNAARANGLISTLHDSSGKRGNKTRMLNGRVYGARRGSAGTNANPFANARDEEPEFVEWGYGGMGSVKNDGVGGSVWGRVMSNGTGHYDGRGQNGKPAIATGEARTGKARTSAGVQEEDDGSGMGWVKKRREERERKEKEEKERKEKGDKEKEKSAVVSDGQGDQTSPNEDVQAELTSSPEVQSPPAGQLTSTLSEEPESLDEGSPAPVYRNLPSLDLSTSGKPPPLHRHSHESPSRLIRPRLPSNVHPVAPMSILTSTSHDSSLTPLNTPAIAAKSEPVTPSIGRTASATPLGPSISGSGVSTVQPTPGPSTPIEDEHVTTIRNIPYKHYHHHHGHSRSKSLEMLKEMCQNKDDAQQVVSQEKEQEEIAQAQAKKVEDDQDLVSDNAEVVDLSASEASMSTQPTIGSTSTTSSIHSSSSESGSPSDTESEPEDDDDDDDDSEDELDAEKRKTSLGAGVEKISRHK